MSASPTRILIAGPAWVGDMVMAQSLFITLKQRTPDCLIDVIAPSWSVPLLQRMPQVNEAIELAVGHKQLKFMTRYRLGKALRARHYDQAIVTPRSFKSALIPFFARARQRTGYRGEHRYGLLNDIRTLDKNKLTQTVQRYVALGQPADASQPPPVPYPALTVDTANQHKVVQRLGLALDKPIVGLMPGAEYGPAKQWPVSHYRELAEQLADKGFNVWVFGSAKEKSLGEVIALANDSVYNLCGQTALVDVIDLIALTHTTVTNDSGLMHIACATGRPVIALYGSSDPAYTPPLSDQTQILYLGLDCSPCFARTCRFGHTNCLQEITPEQVMQLINSAQ